MRSAMNSVSGERPKLLTRLLEHTGKFSTIVYFAAIYYTLLIAGYFGPFSEHTRISEHALMPGLATEKFSNGGIINEYLQKLSKKGSRRQIIHEILTELGVQPHTQVWSIDNSTGQNVYGFVRARRSVGSESILLSAEIEDKEAVSVLLAFISFAKDQPYWARDICIVFVKGKAIGMEAFLSKYYDQSRTSIESDELEEHGGAMIGGIVLKSQKKAASKRATIQIQLNQLNGQLPNLDLFNSIVRIAGTGRFGLETVIYNVYDGDAWTVPLQAIYTQAFVPVEGTHSVFGKYGVQGLSMAIPPPSTYSLVQSTRLVEAITRSLNNVLERLHQSYFMYILTSEDNFLSIAYYMPCMAVTAPLLLYAYREWVNMTAFHLPMVWLISHFYGATIWTLSGHFFEKKSLGDTEILGCLCLLLLPIGIILPKSGKSIGSLRFILYLESALALMSLSLINFGLAFLLAVGATPLILRCTRPFEGSSRTKSLVRSMLLLALNPIILILLARFYLNILGRDNLIEEAIQLIRSLHLQERLFGVNSRALLELVAIPFWSSMVGLSLIELENQL